MKRRVVAEQAAQPGVSRYTRAGSGRRGAIGMVAECGGSEVVAFVASAGKARQDRKDGRQCHGGGMDTA